MFRGLPQLILAGLRSTVRSRAALFWTLAFPSFFVLLFGYVFGRGETGTVTYLMPGLWTITVISSTFFGAALQMVQERENGTFRRYRVTPLSAAALVTSFGVVTLCVLSVSLVVQGVLAWVLFRIQPQGSILDLVFVFLAGLMAFVPLGLLVGSMARDMKSAPVITNLLFFPMMFLSGAAFPFAFLPEFVQKIALFLPSTYLMEALQGVVVRGESLGQLVLPVGVLLLTCVLGLTLNGLLFRWESTQPLDRRNLAIAFGGLIGLYAVVAFAGPTLRMTTMPDDDGASGSSEARILSDTMTLEDYAGPIVVLEGMTVLDGLGGRLTTARIVTRGGRIVQIVPAGGDPFTLPPEIDADEVTVTTHRWDGMFATPGLLDARVHLAASGGGQASMAEWTAQRQVRDLQAYLGNGITTIVSMTDDLTETVALGRAVAAGTMRAPRIVAAGPTFTATGGFPANQLALVPGLAERLTRQVEDAATARAAVDALAESGADAVHVMRWHGAPGQPEVPAISDDAVRAIMESAQASKLAVAIQVQRGEDARAALELGALRIDGLPAPLDDATIGAMRARGAVLVPALVSFERLWKAANAVELDDPLIQKWNDREVVTSLRHPMSWITRARSSREFVEATGIAWEAALESARRAATMGVPMLVGTSSGDPAVLHGSSYVRELELLHAAGVPCDSLLVAATSRTADWSHRPDLGRLVPGARADIVIFALDPSNTVTAYRTLKAVYFDGNRLALDGLLNTTPGTWHPN